MKRVICSTITQVPVEINLEGITSTQLSNMRKQLIDLIKSYGADGYVKSIQVNLDNQVTPDIRIKSRKKVPQLRVTSTSKDPYRAFSLMLGKVENRLNDFINSHKASNELLSSFSEEIAEASELIKELQTICPDIQLTTPQLLDKNSDVYYLNYNLGRITSPHWQHDYKDVQEVVDAWRSASDICNYWLMLKSYENHELELHVYCINKKTGKWGTKSTLL